MAELARLYRLAQDRIKAGDKSVEEAARAETAKLHAGDAENRALWQQFMPHCLAALQKVYDRLGVRFDVELGESFYDPMLGSVVEDLSASGIAEESEGAIVVFTDRDAAPFIIRKRDGAFNYGTTDLATIKYRAEDLEPPADSLRGRSPPGRPFQAALRGRAAVGLRPGRSGARRLRHDPGCDRRPFKTREGDVVGLESLLDEAVAEARKVVDANSPDLDQEARTRVAEVVGLGAIKYADLSQNRLSDYVFDWQKMLAMNGNTATYLQYAYARIQSIFRKGEVDPEDLRAAAAGDRAQPSGRARAGRSDSSLAGGPGAGCRRAQAQHPDGLLVRPGQRVQHLFRGVPRAQGRVGRAARQPPGNLRPHGTDLEIRPRIAWNRSRRPHVKRP